MTKGIHKKQMMRKERVPPKEAQDRVDSWLWDDDTLRVFVDCSELKEQGVFGIGVIFVGQGMTLVKSKKHYNQSMKRMNVYAELVAVEFALIQLDKILNKDFHLPSRIIVFSDWNMVDKLNQTNTVSKRHPPINAVAGKINKRKLQFTTTHSKVELNISYMSEKQKRHNPFYRAAHNASRKAIGIL